jgi:hypothetical protein
LPLQPHGAERSEYRGEQSRSELRGAGTLGIHHISGAP